MFTANTAYTGGAMHNIEATAALTNCIFTSNSATEEGGGLYNKTNSITTLTNCTFNGNLADIRGGGICNDINSTSTLDNCILWGNAAPSGEQIYKDETSSVTVSYSDVQGGWPGIGNIDADPCFVEPEHFGPIAHWKFDEGGGTIAYDSVGDYDGTIYGAQWTTGQIGGGLHFDGDDGVYVEGSYGADSPLNIYNSDMTISAWAKLSGPGGTIVARAKPHYITYRLMTWSTPACISVYAPGHHMICSDAILNQDTWYHMVGVFDRASNTGYLYVDGILEADGSLPDAPPGNSGLTKIGCRNNVYDYPFYGTIDEVMIFNRVLAAEEIQQLYQMGLTGLGDYHLLPNSPCINAGDPDYVPEPNETDLDGLPRVIGGRIDMGAYEFNHIPVADGGDDQIVECACNTQQGTKVTLDGTGSYDPDEDNVILVAEDAAKRVLVPTGPVSGEWKGKRPFDDSQWNHGTPIIPGKTGGVGYERGSGYEDYITYDVEEQMFGNNTTCYIRIPFTVDACDLAAFNYMTLKMRCDDGFIVYLDVNEMERTNFSGMPAWNSQAHGIRESSEFQYYNVSHFLDALDPGVNILAIHGLNNPITSSDFLISAELIASETKPHPSIELEYTWTGPFEESPAHGPAPTVTLLEGCPGEYVITLVVNDGIADSEPNGIVITVVDTTPPDITCPPDLTLECPADTSVAANGSATATDNCSEATITHSDASVSACGNTGTITRTWTATDVTGNSSTCVQTITVLDTTPPVITCPPDVTLECPADTSVEANGSATASDICGPVTITHSDQWQPDCGNTGTITRTWTATDECGNSSTCVQTITVVDTTPPEFEFSVTPTMLWPPNHNMVLITPSWTVTDECDAAPQVSLVGIVANEGDNTIGDGHTTDDIQIGDDGSIYLRSERSGIGNDRVYTITYQAVDDCGNATVRNATVSIPHDFKVLARISARWLWTGPAGRIPEDLNGDGTVNLTDFAKFAENWIK
jgi:hypothetical protein